MTKHHIAIAPALLVLAAALALAACGKSEAPAAEGEAHAAPKSSSAGLPDGHVDAGKKLASTKNAETGQACVDCHGADGNKPLDPTYPKIGGQSQQYLLNALTEYKQGRRKHPTMQAQAESFSDQDIADIAVFLSSLK